MQALLVKITATSPHPWRRQDCGGERGGCGGGGRRGGRRVGGRFLRVEERAAFAACRRPHALQGLTTPCRLLRLSWVELTQLEALPEPRQRLELALLASAPPSSSTFSPAALQPVECSHRRP